MITPRPRANFFPAPQCQVREVPDPECQVRFRKRMPNPGRSMPIEETRHWDRWELTKTRMPSQETRHWNRWEIQMHTDKFQPTNPWETKALGLRR